MDGSWCAPGVLGGVGPFLYHWKWKIGTYFPHVQEMRILFTENVG